MTLKPGERPKVPQTQEELMIAALRCANRVCGAITEIGHLVLNSLQDDGTVTDAAATMEKIRDITIRQFSDLSGVHLFIAASNLRMELPEDLRGDPDDEDVFHDDE